MGGRPLLSPVAIKRRLTAVQELYPTTSARGEIIEILARCATISASRLAVYGRNARPIESRPVLRSAARLSALLAASEAPLKAIAARRGE